MLWSLFVNALGVWDLSLQICSFEPVVSLLMLLDCLELLKIVMFYLVFVVGEKRLIFIGRIHMLSAISLVRAEKYKTKSDCLTLILLTLLSRLSMSIALVISLRR
jgi:hypothetical protein